MRFFFFIVFFFFTKVIYSSNFLSYWVLFTDFFQILVSEICQFYECWKPASWKLQQEEVKKRAAHAIPSLKYISSLCFVKLHRTITKFKNFSDSGKQLPIFISLYFTAKSLVSVSNHGDTSRRQQFAYLTTKNSICSFARFARAYFTFSHFIAVLVFSTTWN